MATKTKTPKPKEQMELLADLGDGLKLYMAPLDQLREQDVNARILEPADHVQLVNNIRKSGHLESVPFCARAKADGPVEIISGHHRIRAAREAGVKKAPILVDESGLSRTELVAKQLAHNRLSGYDDPATLRRLFSILNTPDLILESGLANDQLKVPDVTLDPILAPHLNMDWKVVTFAFLPHQQESLQALIEATPPSDLVAAAGMEQFQGFMEAVVKYARLKKVTNAGMAVALLTRLALELIEKEEVTDGQAR